VHRPVMSCTAGLMHIAKASRAARSTSSDKGAPDEGLAVAAHAEQSCVRAATSRGLAHCPLGARQQGTVNPSDFDGTGLSELQQRVIRIPGRCPAPGRARALGFWPALRRHSRPGAAATRSGGAACRRRLERSASGCPPWTRHTCGNWGISEFRHQKGIPASPARRRVHFWMTRWLAVGRVVRQCWGREADLQARAYAGTEKLYVTELLLTMQVLGL